MEIITSDAPGDSVAVTLIGVVERRGRVQRGVTGRGIKEVRVGMTDRHPLLPVSTIRRRVRQLHHPQASPPRKPLPQRAPPKKPRPPEKPRPPNRLTAKGCGTIGVRVLKSVREGPRA